MFFKVLFAVLAIAMAGVGLISYVIDQEGAYGLWFVASVLWIFSYAMASASASVRR